MQEHHACKLHKSHTLIIKTHNPNQQDYISERTPCLQSTNHKNIKKKTFIIIGKIYIEDKKAINKRVWTKMSE